MDRVDEELDLQISEIVKNIQGVEKVELIASRGTWRTKIIEVHFAVKPGTTSDVISLIQEEIERTIKSRFSEVVSVIPVVRFLKGNVIVAIPSDADGEKYSGDFSSEYFTIVEFEGSKVVSRKVIKNPHFKAEKRKGFLIAELLKENNVSVVVTSKIGEGGKAHLRSKGISIVEIAEAEGEEIDRIINDVVATVSAP